MLQQHYDTSRNIGSSGHGSNTPVGSMKNDNADLHHVMSTLLAQARVCLAQGQPTQALALVLAAVREQRGEAGVFDVLNETRERHGLHRLAVPAHLFGSRLPPAAPPPRQIAAQHRAALGDETMEMEDGDGASHTRHTAASPLSSDLLAAMPPHLDPADAIESLFRSLQVADTSQQQPQQHHQQQQQSQPFAMHVASQAHATAAFSTSIALAASSPASSSSFNPSPSPSVSVGPPPQPIPPQAASAHVTATTTTGTSTTTPSVHYPSMRTVLPSFSAHSTTRLELMHDHDHDHDADVDDSGGGDDGAAGSSTTPLLAVSGRTDVLESAYDDTATNLICPRCSALIPRARFQAHCQYWCQANG